MKIYFADFWPSLKMKDNIFYHSLTKMGYPVVIDPQPDLLFYSNFGSSNLSYHCTKVYYTGENRRPDYNSCDYSITFDFPVSEKNFRLPLYTLYDDITKLLTIKNPDKILSSKTKFCNFVVSNPQGKVRNKFYKLLSEYKKVDSGGRYINNIGGVVIDKSAFIRDYKFTIAFENSSYPGYTTEKIFEPMLQNSLPIYWGNPLVSKDFNTASFINIHDFNNLENAIDHIIKVDQNDSLYLNYLKEPWLLDNQITEYCDPKNLDSFLKNIVEKLPFHRPISSFWQHRLMARKRYLFQSIEESTDYTIRKIRRKLKI